MKSNKWKWAARRSILAFVGTLFLLALIFLSKSELVSGTALTVYCVVIPEIFAAAELSYKERSLKFTRLAFLGVLLLNSIVFLIFKILSKGAYPSRVEELVPAIVMFAVPMIVFAVFYSWQKKKLQSFQELS